MRSFLGRLAQHAVPLVVVCFLVAGSAAAGSLITSAQVKDNSLTGRDIKDGSLSPKDFKGSVRGADGAPGDDGKDGVPGKDGEDGAPGEDGEDGATGQPGSSADLETEEVGDFTPTNTDLSKELTVECPNGPVLGGGYLINSDEDGFRAVRSYAVSSNQWLVRVINDGAAISWRLTVVAVCAK